MEIAVNRHEELKEQLKSLGKSSYEREMSDLKDEIRSCERQVKSALEHIAKYSKKKREYNTKLTVYKNMKEEERDFTSDIDAILSHPTVNHMSVDTEDGNKNVFIHTDYIDIYDEKGNRFKGNKYKVKFNFDNMSVKFYGEDEEYNRESCWGDNCPHPHVDGDNGNPCLGDAGSMLAMTMNEYELYASYIIALNFLQQVNVHDGAGQYIYNWDCIDDNGNIIDNPYENSFTTCDVCDERIYRDDATSCEECGCTLCSDHYYCMEDGTYLCEDCRDEHYDYCNNCEEWYPNNEMRTANDGDTYCSECFNDMFERCDECGDYFRDIDDVDGHKYCSSCMDENTFTCDKCGEIHDNENENICAKCGDSFCNDCFDMEKEKCENCVEESEEE